jgi:hypothetical protein
MLVGSKCEARYQRSAQRAGLAARRPSPAERAEIEAELDRLLAAD